MYLALVVTVVGVVIFGVGQAAKGRSVARVGAVLALGGLITLLAIYGSGA